MIDTAQSACSDMVITKQNENGIDINNDNLHIFIDKHVECFFDGLH